MKFLVPAVSLLIAACSAQAQLLQKPTLSRTEIVFSNAGDLWSVSREGGEARQLTSGPGTETDPFFSPDGTLVAFTGEYDGNVDVYVVPASGGVPRRLTWHPAGHGARLDARRQADPLPLPRGSYSRFAGCSPCPWTGGFPRNCRCRWPRKHRSPPTARASPTCRSPRAFESWKRYRGGQTTPDLDRRPRRFAHREDPARQLQRLQPDVDRRQGLLPLRPQRPGDALRLRPDDEEGDAGRCRTTGSTSSRPRPGPARSSTSSSAARPLRSEERARPRMLDIRVAGDLAAVRPHFDKVARADRERGALRRPARGPCSRRAARS